MSKSLIIFEESPQEKIRALLCDFCEQYAKFDTSKPWLHCSICKRCYTCLKLKSERCDLCRGHDKKERDITLSHSAYKKKGIT